MAQIVVIEPNQNLQELIVLNLKTYLNCEVIVREDAKEAIALMGLLPTIDLVISSLEVGGEQTALELHQFIENEGLDIELLLLGESTEKELIIHKQVANPKQWELIIQSAANILGIKEDVLGKKQLRPEYVAIPLHYFQHLDSTCCDVFLRIKKKTDYQFIKRIHGGDSFSQDMIQKYMDQGVQNFFIPKEEQENFTNIVSDQLVKKLQEMNDQDDYLSDGVVDQKVLKQMGHSVNIAHSEINRVGLNTATVQLTEGIIESFIKSYQKSSQLALLLKEIINSKTSYLYQHAHMCSSMCCQLLEHPEIQRKLHIQQDQEISRYREGLTLAAFLKDIALQQRPHLAKLSSSDEISQSSLNSQDLNLLTDHALRASALVREHKALDHLGALTDDFILTHHGRKDDRGLHNFKESQLDQLNFSSLLFFLCCEFTSLFLRAKEEASLSKPIAEQLKERFSSENEEVLQTISLIAKQINKK